MTELGQAASTTRNGFGEFRDGSDAHAMLAGELINLALHEHRNIPYLEERSAQRSSYLDEADITSRTNQQLGTIL